MLEEVDYELAHHIQSLGVKVGDYMWSSWVNLYTDVLTKSDWLIFFDHLVSYPEYPEMFFLMFIAELKLKRTHILALAEPASLDNYLKNLRIDNVKVSLRLNISMMAELLKDTDKELALSRAIPLAPANYQPFKFIPKDLL
jgi:hypothetical protein